MHIIAIYGCTHQLPLFLIVMTDYCQHTVVAIIMHHSNIIYCLHVISMTARGDKVPRNAQLNGGVEMHVCAKNNLNKFFSR